MIENFDIVAKILGALSVVTSGVAAIVAFVVRREVRRIAVEASSNAAIAKIGQLENSVAELRGMVERQRTDIQAARNTIAAVPTAEALNELRLSNAKLTGAIETIDTKLEAKLEGVSAVVTAMAARVEMINQWLVDRSVRP